MPYTTTPDEIRLYYEELGKGEPLLLVSGRGSDHTDWNAVRDDFAHHYHVIVYDRRGTGQSDKPSESLYTMRGFAQDAIAILDHLDIQRAHVYGISLGGRICQCLGIDHADRIGALVLGCTTPGNVHGVLRPPKVDTIMTNPPTGPQSATAASLDLMFSPTWVAAHSELISSYLSQQSSPPADVQRLHRQASEGYDSWDLLPTIKAPTLVIHGSEDRVAPPANAYLLAERIPHAELYIVNGGRHGYFVEFREEASRVVNEFLARHPL